MARSAVLATLIAGALAAAGCGDERPSAAAVAPAPDAPVTASVEPTEGRLGGATEVSPRRGAQQLSPGGAFDLAERDGAPDRDGVGAGAACPDVDVAPSAETVAVAAEATLCLLNGERADQGLAPLAANGQLATAATAYAQDLVAGSYFSHTGRDGSDVLERIKRTGYIRDDRPWRVGENLAWGTGALATPAAIVRAWMNSPGHRANILNARYREIGLGVAPGNPASPDGAGGTYATAFGAVEQPPAATAKQGVNARKVKRRGRAAAKKARASRRAGAEARAARKARAAGKADAGAKARAAGKGRGKHRAKTGRRITGRTPVARIAV